ACLARQDHDFPITFVSRGLDNTDRRILEGKPVAPAFLFAVLLWEPVRLRYRALLGEGMASAEAMALAAHEVASAQQRRVAIQKRFALPMREIWAMQPQLERRQGKRPLVLLSHPRFRAAYDFLLLRAEAGETDPELAQWWARFQEVDAAERVKMLGGSAARKRKRRKRKPKTEAAAKPAAGKDAAAASDTGAPTSMPPSTGPAHD
ncbi:MAG: polynucleotide adenylyltransferase PcnB, partial [Halochromatium sp.]